MTPQLTDAEVHAALFALELMDEVRIATDTRTIAAGLPPNPVLAEFGGAVEAALVKFRSAHAADRSVGVANNLQTAKTARVLARILMGDLNA